MIQVRPSKNSSEGKHGRSKLPRFLPAHRESRPRDSKGAVCSPAVYEVVESLRRSWIQHRSIKDAMETLEKTLSPRDISCILTELQRQHNWQCTLEVFISPFHPVNGSNLGIPWINITKFILVHYFHKCKSYCQSV